MVNSICSDLSDHMQSCQSSQPSLHMPYYCFCHSTAQIKGTFQNSRPLANFSLETPKRELANSADPDRPMHHVVSDQGLQFSNSFAIFF